MSQATEILNRARAAAEAFRALDQTRVDAIVRAAFLAAMDQRVALAKQAHEETGIGVWQHKVVKNVIAAQLVYEDIKDQRTVGVIAEDPLAGVVEIAQPIGPILAFVPITNPSSTTIFKALIALKTRNPLIVSPPAAARRTVAAAAALCCRAARAAGAPEHCIQWLERPATETIDELLQSRELAMVLATGTGPLVRKAQMSGTPTHGVGPGNVPVYIGRTADVPFAVSSILESKTFDNGTVCASEQAVVVREAVAGQVIAEFERQRGWFLSAEQIEKVGAVAFDRERRAMSPQVVGRSVREIADLAGIDVPAGTAVLLARLDGVGAGHPLSAEILAPILAFYVAPDFEQAIGRCSEIVEYGGAGHTAVIYSNTTERIEYFSQHVHASRILVNMPATFGALGGTYNTLSPSFTLSCGSGGKNSTNDNITARHLLNVHRITRRRPNPRWQVFDRACYLDEGLPGEAIDRIYNRNF
ncbi:MAG: aldehyde dehydrogenase family protein [Planctomycetes bacterium]|nr:aldehyde dehydrogenase family protein [Planctomycetota bacterium]